MMRKADIFRRTSAALRVLLIALVVTAHVAASIPTASAHPTKPLPSGQNSELGLAELTQILGEPITLCDGELPDDASLAAQHCLWCIGTDLAHGPAGLDGTDSLQVLPSRLIAGASRIAAAIQAPAQNRQRAPPA